MEKKTIIFIAAVMAITFFSWFWPTAIFYWKNFYGLKVFFEKPAQDITKTINTTGMPLTLPPGFSISIFASGLENPRVLAKDPEGNLITSIPAKGKVVAMPDFDKNGEADKIIAITEGLNRPHGLAFLCSPPTKTFQLLPLNNSSGYDAIPQLASAHSFMVGGKEKCFLYIAESHRIGLYDYDQKTFSARFIKKIADLPDEGGHFTRTIGFGPDKRLYVSIGSSCNVCHEKDSRRAKIFSIERDGSDFKEFATGLRNSVFFVWHPLDDRMWATEMGRDLLGDDLPPDEINIVEESNPSTGLAARNYGWPVCYGKNIHDEDFDKNVYVRNPCQEPFETPSHIDIPAHSAPLGLAFIPENGWPEEYRHNLLVAYHGSWNRSVPTGYKVIRYILDEKGGYLREEDFITGWLTKNGVIGRPVDIMIDQTSIMYLSDDKAGVIYKIIHNGK